VTSLPATPNDGNECYYLADATNGVLWHLKYRAGSASTYKWEVAGASPLVNNANGGTLSTALAFGDLASGAIPVVVPLAGDYIVDAYAALTATGAPVGSQYAMGPFRGTGQGAPPNYASWNAAAAGYAAPLVHLGERFTGVSAGATFKPQFYSSSSTTSTFGPVRIVVRPIRVG
jgi:hypothetical protein